MNTKPFQHDFKTIFGVIDVPGMNGYVKALAEIQNHLLEVTESNPAKRYVDAVEILERITATTNELQPLMNEAMDEVQTELANLNKAINP